MKIKVRVKEKRIHGFVTEPAGFCVEIEIGAIRLETKNCWLREQDAKRRADYIADKILECNGKDLVLET